MRAFFYTQEVEKGDCVFLEKDEHNHLFKILRGRAGETLLLLDGKGKKMTAEIQKDQSLKVFTENNYAQGSFFWFQLLKTKDIKVNGVRISKDMHLKKGDKICYYTNPKQESKPAFYVLYQDDNFLVVDKESGVNSEAVFAAISRKQECLQCFP